MAHNFIPPEQIKIKTLKEELPKIFIYICNKHGVEIESVNITCDETFVYVYERFYCNKEKKDKKKILELIGL